jgi:hypothetical protein
LTELLDVAEGDVDELGSLAFVLSRANVDGLFERETDVDDVDDLETELGHEVRIEGGMPDDTVLLLDPDAVEGADLLKPESIACGIFGSDR